ncbi:tetratricopeptide repeat protein [Micromonospora rubida]|uniref:Tetratricopeptide repeat protein n=1 Tax=Micromonospora rubida TaxID=2697657 RepID=A0ABW7SYR6_9ACTN
MVAFGDVIAVSGVAGNVTITTTRPPYRVETFPTVTGTVDVESARQRPSRLLLAQHRVVELVGRDGDLAEAAGWMARPGGVLVRLVHAAGGQGKTRLAAHIAEACAVAGWAVWRVLHEPVFSGGYRMDLPAGGGLLVVVDYADRWPVNHLQSLFTHLKSMNLSTGLAVRVLLLARSTTAWWPTLRNRLRSDHQVEATTQRLAPLGDRVDRKMLFQHARDRFAAALDVTGTERLPPPDNLADDAFRQVLSVHMAALVTVDAHLRNTAPPTHPHALSSYLLERERDHWYTLHHRPAEPRKTPPEVMGRAVYLATLTAALPRATATDLLHRVGLTEPGTTTIIDDHRFCYPPDDPRIVLQALHPDRLGEDLIALFTPGHPHTGDEDGWDSDDWAATAAEHLLRIDTDPPPWAANAVTVLVETAHRWPHIASDVLYPLVRQHPHLVVSAGGAVLARLANIPDVEPAVLETLESLLPLDQHIDLDIAAAAITAALLPHRLSTTTDPAAHAFAHSTLSMRLAKAGLFEDALAAAEKATGAYRQLAEVDPGSLAVARLPDLAVSLDGLGTILWRLGRRDEAAALAEEVLLIHAHLAEDDPNTYLARLATSVATFGDRLSAVERREKGILDLAHRAADYYRRLAEADPVTHLPGLAHLLTSLANFVSAEGQRDEAVALANEAAYIHRQLAQSDSTITHQLNHATSLNNLGNYLAEAGRYEQALALAEEATDTYRQLAQGNPAAYLPDLAMSLSNLGTFLSNVGQCEDALTPSAEAVALRRQLAEANPAANLAGLARSLSNLGVQLSKVGRRGEALAHANEAIVIRRRLAQSDPISYLPDLAMSLGALAQALAAEQTELHKALSAAQEAELIFAHLAEDVPQRYAQYAAAAALLTTKILDLLGRTEEAAAMRQLFALRDGKPNSDYRS